MSEASSSRSAARCCRAEYWNHPGTSPASSRATSSASPRNQLTRPTGWNPRQPAWAGREPSRTGAGRNWSCAWSSRAPFRPRGGASCRPRGAARPNGGIRPSRKTAAAPRGAPRPLARTSTPRPKRPSTRTPTRTLAASALRAVARAPGQVELVGDDPWRWKARWEEAADGWRAALGSVEIAAAFGPRAEERAATVVAWEPGGGGRRLDPGRDHSAVIHSIRKQPFWPVPNAFSPGWTAGSTTRAPTGTAAVRVRREPQKDWSKPSRTT